MNAFQPIAASLPLLLLLFSTIGLFLSLWIIIPAPTLSLLILGIGAPEVSPWLIVGNTIVLVFAIIFNTSWLCRVAIINSVFALCLSSLPLLQLPVTEQRSSAAMQQALGNEILQTSLLKTELKTDQVRSRPFVLFDAFRGIPLRQIREASGIPFAAPDGVPLTLTLYRPPEVGQYPTIVMIYGGAWQNGQPGLDAQFGRYMAGQGYTVVAIDYRHAPRYQFPAQLIDVQTALSYIQTHSDELEVNIDQLAVLGRSAGAHLAMLLAYQPQVSPFRAVVNYYGPVNLANGYRNPPQPDPINTHAVLEAFLGGSPDQYPTQYEQASPSHYIRPNLPPSLLVYAGRDHIVQAKYGRSLFEQLQKTQNTAVLIEIPWAEHAFDAVFNGVSNQLALYYIERFLAWALQQPSN
ncbi:MAG TPA: alpha/beta hydrolase [Trichocoleus sp.]|jgi:acetyl esterase/lipase